MKRSAKSAAKVRGDAKQAGGGAPKTMREVFAWSQTEAYAKPQLENFRKQLPPLERAFAHIAPGKIDQKLVDQYMRDRIDEGYAEATAKGELIRLKAIMRAYDLPVHFKEGRIAVNRVSRIFERIEILRLLDDTANLVPSKRFGVARSQVTKPTGSQAMVGRRRTARARHARYILLAVMTGCTDACACRLRWSPSADNDVSYVDLDAGLLYRLGKDRSKFEKFANVPVKIPASLLRIMRFWRAADRRRGYERVLHLPDGSDASTKMCHAVACLAERLNIAGMSPQALVDTCAGRALERGAPLYGVAILLGINPVVAKRRYDHFRHDFQEKAMEVFEDAIRSKGKDGA